MKFKKYLSSAAFFLLCVSSLSSCNNNNNYEVLRVYNCEDYIYEGDEENNIDSLVNQFITYMDKTYNRNIKVVYDTYDTNESMLSQVKTGKVSYDLICPSDYTIQKMIAEDLIIPFEDDKGNSLTPIYDDNASKFLINKLNNIIVSGHEEEIGIVNKYARGYMWGTLGLLYNPNNVDEEDFKENYSMLWDKKYFNKISIKDSMRDTYAIGVIEAYKDEFTDLYNQYKNNSLDGDFYNKKITEYFNSSSEETLNKVLSVLMKLKENIFGFEVDSGKQDIQTGKIDINLAWSGDATYAMDCALEETGMVLKYILPNIGANIWFDGWVMPKGANTELASKFVDFLSMPNNASQNMEGIGYTPFIAGEDIFNLISEWYGTSEDEIENFDDYFKKDLSYFFKNNKDDENDYYIYIENDLRGTQIDTQYPDEEKLNSLCVMDDFGTRTKNVLAMWEKVKNNTMPMYFYYTLLGIILAVIAVILFNKIRQKRIKKERIQRLKERKLANK